MIDIAEIKLNNLELEQQRLAETFAKYGKVKKSYNFLLELPNPIKNCLPETDLPLNYMTENEKQLFQNLRGTAKIFMTLCSDTKIDTGSWLKKSHLWLACTENSLLLWAAGKKSFSIKIPYDLLKESIYNHITGELILFPAPQLKYKNIKVSPQDGFQILAQIYNTGGK